MKNMIFRILTAFFAMSLISQAATQTGVFTLADGDLGNGLNRLTVDEGFDVEIIGFALLTPEEEVRPSRQSRIVVDGDSFEVELIEGVAITGTLLFQGPLRIEARAEGGEGSLASVTIKITRSKPPADVVPNNSVVIPAGETGPLEIVLESSSDLLNWQEAMPGVVTDGEGLFYRIRVKRN